MGFFDNKFAASLSKLATASVELAKETRDSERFQKFEKAVIANAKEAMSDVKETANTIRTSDLGRKVEDRALEISGAAKVRIGDVVHKLTHAENREWYATVRTTLAALNQDESARFLQSIQPDALVKAMYLPETIEVIRNAGDAFNLNDANDICPQLKSKIAGHFILQSSNDIVADDIRRLPIIEKAPTLSMDTPTL